MIVKFQFLGADYICVAEVMSIAVVAIYEFCDDIDKTAPIETNHDIYPVMHTVSDVERITGMDYKEFILAFQEEVKESYFNIRKAA